MNDQAAKVRQAGRRVLSSRRFRDKSDHVSVLRPSRQGPHVVLIDDTEWNIFVARFAFAAFPSRRGIILRALENPCARIGGVRDKLAQPIVVNVRKSIPRELEDVVGISGIAFESERCQPASDESRWRQTFGLELFQDVGCTAAADTEKHHIDIFALEIGNRRSEFARIEEVVADHMQTVIGGHDARPEQLRQRIAEIAARQLPVETDERGPHDLHLLHELSDDRHTLFIFGRPGREDVRIIGDESGD